MNTISPFQILLRQIMIATDLSEASTNAMNYAKAIAKRYSSQIFLVHISQPAARLAIPEGCWVEDPSTRKAEEELETMGAALRSEGYHAAAISGYGSVAHEVLSLARTHNADMVILGTHGKRGIERLLFGSDAEALIRQCDRPVLTVGPAAVPPQSGSWHPTEIVCAVSSDRHAAKAAAYGCRLARDNGAAFTLSYIDSPDYPFGSQNWRTFTEAFDQSLPGEGIQESQIQVSHSTKGTAMGLIEIATKRKADLIVLGAKHAIPGSTHFRWGVLPEVLLHAPSPVLTIRSLEWL